MRALPTVFNSLVFLETRRLVQVFPEHVRKLWNYWEVRVLVLVSLTLQLCLLHFGSRRRYSVQSWLGVFLWLSYLGADSVATVALGVISNNQGNCNDSQLQNELIAFWAPFLLLHLGGQDTITAYAVQDTELWLRHLLGLVVQSGVALYIILLSWKVSWLSFLTIPMFFAGFIKYAERMWVLKSANCDPFAKWLKNGIYVVSEGADPKRVLRQHILESPDEPCIGLGEETQERRQHCSAWDQAADRRSYPLFVLFRRLFLNQAISSYARIKGDYSNFRDSQPAWKAIEDELGYAYDVYYTKAPLFFTAWGFLIRFFSFASILFVFVLFLIKERLKHPQIDLIITYLLLVGAILIEIYGVILLCASDWPWTWVEDGWLIGYIKTLFAPIRNRCAKLTSKQRWSNSMGQLDLLGLCLNDKSRNGDRGPNLFDKLRAWVFEENQELEMFFYRTRKQVSDQLKKFVFDTFKEKLHRNSNGFSEEYNKYIANGTVMLETYQSIIIWHIATDLLFYTDTDDLDSPTDTDRPNSSRKVSKDVSDYMMYILTMCPLVLSTGNAKLGVEETCTSLEMKIENSYCRDITPRSVCENLMSEGTTSDPGQPLSDGRYLCVDGLLPSAVSLAVQLAEELNQKNGKWKILSKFWVENLAYVATLCQGNNHAQLLRKGGEFLSHVWLLIEHFGLTESFQSSLIRPQEEEARVSSVVTNDESVTGSETGCCETGSVSKSCYGRDSGNGSAAVSGSG